MSLSLKDIKKKVIANKKEGDGSLDTNEKESLLRPWQHIKQEKDLVEIITSRKNKKNKVQRKAIKKPKYNKPIDDKTSEEYLNSKIKSKASEIFKDII